MNNGVKVGKISLNHSDMVLNKFCIAGEKIEVIEKDWLDCAKNL